MSQPRHPAEPCSTCPYRKDAPIGRWHRSEFEGLLASEASQLGTVYACHGHGKLGNADRGLCAGWLLDQKKRNVPSIKLRLLLMTSEAACAAIEAVTAGGQDLFPSLAAMCRANGVRRP
jgi:hypothetical protein